MKVIRIIGILVIAQGLIHSLRALGVEKPSIESTDRATGIPSVVVEKPSRLSAPISSENLWDEVISTTENPRAYDWRQAKWEVELGIDEIDERTVFRSAGYHLGIGIPFSSGTMIRAGLRRIHVNGSRAGDLIERTPYRQPAQPNRYEIFGLFSYSIAEGRAFTRLSPLIGDCEHALSLEVGGHYSHPSPKIIPKRDAENSRVNGQLSVNSTWVGHLGARYVLYVPNGLGFFVSPSYEIPFSKLDGPLTHWFTFSFGAVISVARETSSSTTRSTRAERED